jgi:hypothetical protein
VNDPTEPFRLRIAEGSVAEDQAADGDGGRDCHVIVPTASTQRSGQEPATSLTPAGKKRRGAKREGKRHGRTAKRSPEEMTIEIERVHRQMGKLGIARGTSQE